MNCVYSQATAEGLWVCIVCGRPVQVVSVGGVPLDRLCSEEFGRFDNVTSREKATLIDAIDALHVLGMHFRCDACNDMKWPCPTHRLIHPEDGES